MHIYTCPELFKVQASKQQPGIILARWSSQASISPLSFSFCIVFLGSQLTALAAGTLQVTLFNSKLSNSVFLPKITKFRSINFTCHSGFQTYSVTCLVHN